MAKNEELVEDRDREKQIIAHLGFVICCRKVLVFRFPVTMWAGFEVRCNWAGLGSLGESGDVERTGLPVNGG